MSQNIYTQSSQPDVLEVIANLSNEAVFTPPRVANAVLDLLPEHVWTDPALRWLDPGSKTGVFPREITKRLMAGLTDAIPDEQERLDHILKNMVFAIATESMTALMARRTLYCSKDASSELSAVQLACSEGNIWHRRVEHNFDKKGRCVECGGNKALLEQDGRDNKAYGFIHESGKKLIEQEFAMKFDVVVGNPPYQMTGGGGGTNDTPLYHTFVENAISLNPSYIAMIIPSRWMAGGRGLDTFRALMLGDRRLRVLVDFSKMDSLFPGVDFEGGVCYFLWDREHSGDCESTFVQGEERIGPQHRSLDEFDVFVRDSRAIAILRKVFDSSASTLSDMVSGDTPFGLATNFVGFRKGARREGDLELHMTISGKRVEKWIPAETVSKNTHLINKWKVFIPEAYGERGAIPAFVIGPPKIGRPWSVCTQTFLSAGPFRTKSEALSFETYLRTRFVRFLISLRKISQHAPKSVYGWVPQQAWDREWTDVELYKKYGITKDEQEYIESMVKEMPA